MSTFPNCNDKILPCYSIHAYKYGLKHMCLSLNEPNQKYQYGKKKKPKNHTVKTITKSNIKIVERGTIDTE